MSEAAAFILVPVPFTSAMIEAGTTVPEVDADAGEVAWVSGGNYVKDNLRTNAGAVYSCVRDHSGRSVLPANDSAYWLRKGPTNRLSPFDAYRSTKATALGSITYVLRPGPVDGLQIYGLEGDGYSITVTDPATGDPIMPASVGELYAQAAGYYELLFSPLPHIDELGVSGIPLHPDPRITITITGGVGARVAIGDIRVGGWRTLIGDGPHEGVEYGASGERKPFSYRKVNEDGTVSQVRRPSAQNVRCTVVIDPEQAIYAQATLDEVEEMSVPFKATGLPRYGFLNTLAFISATFRADDFGNTSIDLQAEGVI